VLVSGLPEENNSFETSTASPDGTAKDKSKPTGVATLKKFKKDSKIVRK